ncbi:MAG: hypothetical protein M2R45_01197 [Verrucomicrobia subdivision 3 bacterium]|nr:hypothetical protein [Limisphaerales bacterium]MCS1415251.1 hypothetical protein [Limisphaerales bacterium]
MNLKSYFIPDESALTKRLKGGLTIVMGTVIFAAVFIVVPPLSMIYGVLMGNAMELVRVCFDLVFMFLWLSGALMLLPVAVWGSWRQRVPALLGVAFLLFLVGVSVRGLLNLAQ